ncbi:MAG: glycosyltransferase family 2 protein [Cyanobium sp.]
MRLILTLLCRNEADILASHLDFHLSRGVDLILATDNGSIDGSEAILADYERRGLLRLLQEPSYTHDQAVWVTRMAQIATEELGADWLIHSDADEFWWPRSGDLKAELAALPPEVQAVQVERNNLLPPAEDASGPFHQTMLIRERRSLNSLGEPLLPKVCHRAAPDLAIDDGNHAVFHNGERLPLHPCDGLEILHLPVRSSRQLERKIRNGAQALARNSRLHAGIGSTWRHLYETKVIPGRMEEYYRSLRPAPAALAEALERGELLEDRRLQQALAALQDGPMPPASPGS